MSLQSHTKSSSARKGKIASKDVPKGYNALRKGYGEVIRALVPVIVKAGTSSTEELISPEDVRKIAGVRPDLSDTTVYWNLRLELISIGVGFGTYVEDDCKWFVVVAPASGKLLLPPQSTKLRQRKYLEMMRDEVMSYIERGASASDLAVIKRVTKEWEQVVSDYIH